MAIGDMKIVVNGVDLRAEGQLFTLSPDALIEERARLVAKWHAEEVEHRILAGENEFTLGDVHYTVPAWHREPIKRLRVEWARWKGRP